VTTNSTALYVSTLVLGNNSLEIGLVFQVRVLRSRPSQQKKTAKKNSKKNKKIVPELGSICMAALYSKKGNADRPNTSSAK
jgi:hypothetical protein